MKHSSGPVILLFFLYITFFSSPFNLHYYLRLKSIPCNGTNYNGPHIETRTQQDDLPLPVISRMQEPPLKESEGKILKNDTETLKEAVHTSNME